MMKATTNRRTATQQNERVNSADAELLSEKIDETAGALASIDETLQEINATLTDGIGEFRRLANILDSLIGVVRDSR